MSEITSRRRGEILRKIFEILLTHPDGLKGRSVLANVEQELGLTGFERSEYPNRPEVRRFERIAHFCTVSTVKARWVAKERQKWVLTDLGREAFDRFSNPEQVAQEASRLYRA